MVENQEVNLREVSSELRGRLFRRRGGRPDMDIRTGPIRAVVVFQVADAGVSAYYRISEKEGTSETRVVTGSTQDEVSRSVLGIIFHRDQVQQEPRLAMDFRKYGGKTT
jgi:hypothetical protein